MRHDAEGFYIQPAYSNLLLLLHLSLYHTLLFASRQDQSGTTRRRVVHPAQQPSRYGVTTDISVPEWSHNEIRWAHANQSDTPKVYVPPQPRQSSMLNGLPDDGTRHDSTIETTRRVET
jgi:hypothetical protein